MRLIKAAKASHHAKFYSLITGFNRFKKVLDSVGQSEYHSTEQLKNYDIIFDVYCIMIA